MMEEFTISFHYQNKNHKAGVVKTGVDKDIEYDIRPAAPEIVRQFGKQIRVFRTSGKYKIQDPIVIQDKKFYIALISAIQQNEYGNTKETLEIVMKKEDPSIDMDAAKDALPDYSSKETDT